MADSRKTWGSVRRIYFAIGILGLAIATIWLFVPGSDNPFLLFVLPVLILDSAVLADDELLNRIHRIAWRREWPK